MAAGAVALVGWLANVDLLRGDLPGLPGLKANAALCFLLAGMALRLRLTPVRSRTGDILALVLSAIGTLTLLQYAFGVSLGLDELLFRDPNDLTHPGRMAEATAACFAVLGFALFLLDRHLHASQALLIVAAGASLGGLLGYLFRAGPLHGVPSYMFMALPTAALLTLLSAGILCARPQRGVFRVLAGLGSASLLARRLLVGSLLSTLLLGLLVLQGLRANWYDAPFALGLLAATLSVAQACLIGWHVLSLSREEALRRQAQQSLQASEEQFRTLADNMSQFAWMTDETGWIFWYNRRWYDYTGTTLDQMQGWGWQAVHHPDHVGRVVTRFRDCIERGEVWEDTFPLRGADGQFRWFLSRARPIRDADGRVVRWFGTNTDVTGQLAAEDALRKSEAQFRAVFELAGVGMAQADPHTRRLLRVNARLSMITGYSEAELLGMGIDHLNHPDDAERDVEGFRDLLAGAPAYHVEKRYRRKDGETAWVRSHVTLVRTGDGAPVRTVAVIEDVTERRRAEETLHQSEARFRELAEAMPQIVWVSGPDGQLEYVNRRWTEYTGLDLDATRRVGSASVIAAEDWAAMSAVWAESFPKGQPYEAVFRLRRAGDGALRWHLARSMPVKDETGRVVRWYGTTTDIDDRKRAEESLAQHAEDLARSNQMLEQFAYVASHDLQEPLRSVASFVELLGRRYQGRLGPEADEYIQFASGGAKRMQQLIQDLLAYSRAGRSDSPLQPTDLGLVLADALQDLRVQVEETGATVTHDPLPTLPGDAVQLGQLLQNLIGNAIKYRKDGEPPRVHVSAERHGVEWVVSVRDNGIGIAPRYAERIFVLFKRLHRDAKYPGTGIGLAICQRIVDRHRGRIWVDSQPNEGATFRFSLPAAAGALTTTASQA